MYRDQFGEFVCGYWGLKGQELSADVVVFHKRFDLSEVFCTREFQFVPS